MKSLDLRRVLGLVLISGGLLLAAVYFSGQLDRATRNEPTPQSNVGPLVPTPIGKAPPTAPPERVPALQTIAPAGKRAIITPIPSLVQLPYTPRQRVCVGVPFPDRAAAALDALRPGWYLDWRRTEAPTAPPGVEYAQMVRVPQGKIVPDLETLARIAQRNPGALWLIGNEMDVIWQDNATPAQYAAAYHAVYTALKQADPRSRIAIGGVTQPSPLRLRYLEAVLHAYRDQYGQEMPIDIWNVHNFILPEERGSWGVDIPPGIEATRGLTYTIEDHDDLAYFKQQLLDFRRWMAQHGYRDKELLVSEYGILMYEDYGFTHARVRDFMLGSFAVMQNTKDAEVGLPADDNRLVQRWCWYSLADTHYPTGNLSDLTNGELTPLGRDLKAYLDQSTP